MQSQILLIHPPHTAIGQPIPKVQLPPLGLLRIGGRLFDAGFTVTLLDAEFGLLSLFDIVRETRKLAPQFVLIGHSGSSSVHAIVVVLCAMLKTAMPHLAIVCGGVLPTGHYNTYSEGPPRSVMRGEGEPTARN